MLFIIGLNWLMTQSPPRPSPSLERSRPSPPPPAVGLIPILFQVNFAKRSECKRCDSAMREEWRCKGEGGGIGLDRWQAEVQQHQEYLDKVKRVQERKQANLRKLEEAGFTCTLEQCGQHFSSLPLFKEHVIKHKAKMKERLVCTEQVSKTAVCEQKFTNRRAYNEHQEEHKAKRLKVFQQDVRSVLLVNKLGLLLEAFEKEYRTMVGQMVPYKALGFSSSLELLQACKEAVEVRKVEGGHTLLVGKPDAKTAHMARMVANQREECRGYDYRTGEVLKNQSLASKKNIQKVAGERKRQATPFLKEQVGRMMDLEEHQAGLEFGEFLDAYQQLHDYPLEPDNFGFFGLSDLLHHGLSCTVSLRLGNLGQWMVFPRRSFSSVLADLPQDLCSDVRQLLASRPDGLEVEALPFVYSQFGDLHLPSLGFTNLEELCLAFAQAGVCIIQSGRKGQLLLLPIIAPMEEMSEAKHSKMKSDTLLPLDDGIFFPSDLFKVPLLENVKEDTWLEVLSEPYEDKAAAQLVDERDKLWWLEEDMEAYYSSGGGAGVSKQLSTGQYVVHLSPQSGVWQRGKVVGQVGEEVDIAYWDYPGLARVHASTLRNLESRFTQLPALMVLVRCSQLPRKPNVGELVQLKKEGGKVKWTKSVPELNEEENFKRVVLAMMGRACEA